MSVFSVFKQSLSFCRGSVSWRFSRQWRRGRGWAPPPWYWRPRSGNMLHTALGPLKYFFNVIVTRDEDPDQLLYSLDPVPEPTCNNVLFHYCFHFHQNKPESTNSSLKLWFIRSDFMLTYLKYKYIFFIISN